MPIWDRSMNHLKAMFFLDSSAENFDVRWVIALRLSRLDGDFLRTVFYAAFQLSCPCLFCCESIPLITSAENRFFVVRQEHAAPSFRGSSPQEPRDQDTPLSLCSWKKSCEWYMSHCILIEKHNKNKGCNHSIGPNYNVIIQVPWRVTVTEPCAVYCYNKWYICDVIFAHW